jgi:hypothetical protein
MQREGIGNESLLYAYVEITKCAEVVQWGVNETGLNGVPTLIQWCRIKAGSDYKIVTLECAGLLTGSTSARVAEHIHESYMGAGTTGYRDVVNGIASSL